MNRPEGRGPVDLRLVAPALAAWAAAALALDAPAGWSAAGAGLGVVVAGLLMAAGGGRPGPLWKIAPAAAAALLCAAAGAGVAGLQRAEARAGPVAGLARDHARVHAELTVGSDPRVPVPRGGSGPPLVVLDAVVTRVTGPDGARTRVETPVRVLAAHPGWARLQPSTRVAVDARLAPARSGERAGVLLRPAGDTPPEVTGGPDPAQRFAGRLRAGLREATEGLAPDAGALLPGLVVGDTSRVPPDLHEAFRATDLLHLLAVSGSNLTVVLFLLIGPPARAQQAERGGLAPRLGLSLRATAVCGAALTSAFVVVCRPEPSVLRAAACGAVTLLAIATGRRRSLIPALGAAVLLLVLYDPWLARSHGFLLSVLATGALLTLAPRWSEALRRRGMRPRLAEALGAAAAAQAVCAPVVAVLAARVSLVAVPCNLLAELAAGPATVLGFATLAAAPVWMPAARVLAWCAGVPAGWIAAVARAGARLPGAELSWPGGLTGGLLLAAATAALVGLGARFGRRRWVCAALAVLLLLVVLRPPQLTRTLTGWPPPDWSYVQCAVGQGGRRRTLRRPGRGPRGGHRSRPRPGGLLLEIPGGAPGADASADALSRRPRGRSVRGAAGPVRGCDSGHRAGRAAGAGGVRPPDRGGRRRTRRAGGRGGAEASRSAGVGGALAAPGRTAAGRAQRRQRGSAGARRGRDAAAARRPRTASAASPVEGPSGTGSGGRPQGRAPRLRTPGPRAARPDPAPARARPGRRGQPLRAPRTRYAHPAAGVGGDRAAHRHRRLDRGHRKRPGDAGGSGQPAAEQARAYRARPLCLPPTRQHDRMRLRQNGPSPHSTGVHQPCSVADGGWRRPEVPAHRHPRH